MAGRSERGDPNGLSSVTGRLEGVCENEKALSFLEYMYKFTSSRPKVPQDAHTLLGQYARRV